MKPMSSCVIRAAALVLIAPACFGAAITTVGFNDSQSATPDFKFSNVPSPSKVDAASKAQFYLSTGEKDESSAELFSLHDGKLPASADDASGNFFFKAGSDGGRLVIDLGSLIDVKQINTYSWNSGSHAAQVYKVYGSDGRANNFSTQSITGGAPESFGWKRITKVDTRPAQGTGTGQYGVSVSDANGTIGKYRYIMFDFSPTEKDDDQGNTYYSEIDVVDANAPSTARMLVPPSNLNRREFAPGVGIRLMALNSTAPANLPESVAQGGAEFPSETSALAAAIR
jgi:hypothetical protein